MESEAKIRRLFFVQKLSIAEIVRQTRVSRNTVRRVIRAEKAGRIYKRSLQPMPVLNQFKETLEGWLIADHKLSKKERRSAKKYFTELHALGYSGAYDSIQRFVKGWKRGNKEVGIGYIPQYFAPGEAYQFDWSEEIIELSGVVQKIKVAQFRLSYSRKFFLVAYIRETQEMLFDAHDLAFKFFGGLTVRGIYDNMKTAVDTVFAGKQRTYNRRFLSLMDHYLIEPTACTPSAGWEKGQIENQVDNVRDWLFKPRLKYRTLTELNNYLAEKCQELACNRKHPEKKEFTIEEIYQEERSHLRTLKQPFDSYREVACQVYSTSLVQFDRNRYSVDCAYINKIVTLKAYATTIEIFSEQEKIASHERLFGRNKTLFNPWHYLPLLERKPGALRNGAPFKDWELPDAIVKVKNILLKRNGGDRECVSVLLAMSEYGIEEVNTACELAIVDKVVSSNYIINILNRLTPTGCPETIETPVELKLQQEPQANCHKYNLLLTGVSHVIH
jgi:transposase